MVRSRVVLLLALVGCTPFGASGDGGPGEAGTGAPDGGPTIRCGKGRCPVDAETVCCVTGAGEATCTKRASCNGATMACSDTEDCAQRGFEAGVICCAENDGMTTPQWPQGALTRSACVFSSNCDATGPRDQTCNSAKSAGQCLKADDSQRTSCVDAPYSNAATGFSICKGL